MTPEPVLNADTAAKEALEATRPRSAEWRAGFNEGVKHGLVAAEELLQSRGDNADTVAEWRTDLRENPYWVDKPTAVASMNSLLGEIELLRAENASLRELLDDVVDGYRAEWVAERLRLIDGSKCDG